jgi:hypothetical protein
MLGPFLWRTRKEKVDTVSSIMKSSLLKAAYFLWFVLGVAFDWIELKLFHSSSGIGLAVGIIFGGLVGYAINRRQLST